MFRLIALIISIPLIALPAEWQALNGPSLGRADDMSMGQYAGSWRIYAADNQHRLYKSDDLGESWDSIVSHQDVVCPTCVVTKKTDFLLVYVGKWRGQPSDHCIWKSTNGGVSWNPKDTPGMNNKPVCLAMDPTNSQTIYAGFDESGGTVCLYKTTDGGGTWVECPVQNVTVRDIWIDPDSTNILYIATSQGVKKSVNSGTNWSTLPSPPNSNDIYCLTYNKDLSTPALYVANKFSDPPVIHVWIYYTTNDVDWQLSYYTSSIDYDIRPSGIEVEEDENGQKMYASFWRQGFIRSDNAGYSPEDWEDNNNGIVDTRIHSLLQHPASQSMLFIGGEYAIYKNSVQYASGEWFEKTKGMQLDLVGDIAAVDGRVCVSAPISSKGLSVSYDAGVNWQWVYFDHEYEVSDVEIAPSNADIIYGSFWGEYGTIIRSIDGGKNWTIRDWLVCGVRDLSISKINPDYVFACGNYSASLELVVWNTTNGGESWNTNSNFPNIGRLNTIVTDPQTDPSQTNIAYTGGFYQLLPRTYSELQKTVDAVHWVRKNSGFPYASRVWDIEIDPIDPNNLYAGNSHGVFKSKDAAESWEAKNTGLVEYYTKDVEIDSVEPSIIYAISQVDGSSTINSLYCTVDGAGSWFKFVLPPGQNPPSYISELAIDNSHTDRVYATAEEEGVYVFYPQYKNKQLTSSTDKATSINNGKKMIRGGVDDLWIIYESGGVIYVVHSSDGGDTWSRKMEIGCGYNPSISSNPNAETPIPGIVWWAQGDKDTLYFAKHVSGYNWTTPVAIEVSADGCGFGPPSFIIGTDNKGRMVYPTTSDGKINYTEFDINNPNPSDPEEVGDGINPSIGFMLPGGSHPEIHIVWQDNKKIRYRSRTISGTWGDRETVCGNNSYNPSIEVSGTVVYIVWMRFEDIQYTSAVYTNGSHFWTEIVPFSTNYALDYPVLSGGNAISCAADVDGNYEIYFWYNAGVGWVGPINISTSNEYSHYPHIVHKQTVLGTVVYFTWTEKDNAPFDVMFENYTFGGSSDQEDLAFYIAEGGEANASPFNLHRDGYVQYGSEFYKKIDYDSEYLEYQFEGLNSEREYALATYAYQEGNNNLPIIVKIDNITIGGINLPPETLIVCKEMIPENFYSDKAVNVKIFGNNAVSAALVLYEYERESDKGGGPQDAGATPLNAGQLSLNVFPNPAHKNVSIQYTIPQPIKVNLSIYDVAGRLINTLINSIQNPGSYQQTFNTTHLSQGVYFVRLHTGDKSIVEKVIFLR